MTERRVLLQIGLLHGSTADQIASAVTMLREVIEAEGKDVRFDRAHFKGFGPTSLDFEAVYWVQGRDYGVFMDHQQSVNLELMRRFEKAGLDFAFPTRSLSGGVLQMINHGVSTGALFLLVGMIYERRSTRKISELKGIQQVAPIFAAGFMLVMLSSIGVPGLNGFVGEFLILIGSFLTARWWTVVAATGVIFAALYLLWAYQRVFHGEPDEANKKFREISFKEGAVLLPFLAAIVFMGVYPKPVLDRIEPSIDKLISHVEAHTDYVEPEPTIEIGVVPEAPAEGEHSESGDAEEGE
jgi:hypothetical protein